MKKVIILLLFGLFLGGNWSCDSAAGGNPENQVDIGGMVFSASNNTPIPNAVIQIVDTTVLATTTTNENGRYEATIEVTESRLISIVAFKESYIADTTEVLAVPQRSVEAPFLELTPTASTPGLSGEAASIPLFSQSATDIGVKESGAVETAQLVFVVQDSNGIPIDLDNQVSVRFLLGSSPGGDEYLSPTSGLTDHQGRVQTYLFSGTRAGVVQIVAEATVGTRTLRSLPVAVAIHGGLPDAAHFSMAVEKLNFPGLVFFGLTNQITAFVGDKYSNPVRPGTSVYFNTTGGIIGGSAVTSESGLAPVNLISAAPLPVHPTLGPGFATITASTADENQQTISVSGVVLFSGAPIMSINPTTVNVPNGGSQTFVYNISDFNNNPLSGGTSFNVQVDGENVRVLGRVSGTIPDTQYGWTEFSFTVADSNPAESSPEPVVITVSTSGPNGSAAISISGTSR